MRSKIKIHTVVSAILGLLLMGCSEVIFETDISQSYVNVLAPIDKANVSSGVVSFHWDAVENADKYHLQIATPDFDNAKQIVADSSVTGNSFNWQLVANTYEWRIRAENSAFETEYFYQSLHVMESNEFPDQKVILIAPEAAAVTNQATQKLQWAEVPGAIDYRLQVFSPDTNGQLVHDQGLPGLEQELQFEDGNFVWQVRAQNATQNTLYSSRQLLIDTKEPNAASLQAPENNSVQPVGEVTFSWERTDLSGSIEFDSIFIYSDKEQLQLVQKARSDTKSHQRNMEAGDYYWLVKSFDQAGNSGASSNVFEFEVK